MAMTTWTTATDWPRALVRAADLTSISLLELLDLARRMKAEPDGWLGALRGDSVAAVFEKPSLRTRVSVETAAHRLGMMPVSVRPGELVAEGEGSLDDVVRMVSEDVAAVLVRAATREELARITRVARAPVINALSDDHHPCQALADLLTLRERFGSLEGLVLAYVGPAGNIAHSLMEAGVLAGMDVRVACPPDHRPAEDVETEAKLRAPVHDASLTVSEDPGEAVADADAVYTAPWPSSSRATGPQAALMRTYRVDGRLMRLAKPSAVFMHPHPAHRGEEVAPAVVDGPHSVVWEQAANRLPTHQAAIYALVAAGRPETRGG